MAELLHLRAEDAEDLAVISSCVQDALVPLGDMRYERAGGTFILAINRFRWESHEDGPLRAEPEAETVFARIASAITFEGVRKVSVQGLDQSKRDHLLELLAIVTGEAAASRLGSAAGQGGTTILLVFAGGGTIRLDADRISCRLRDFGEAWPTRWQPRHRLET